MIKQLQRLLIGTAGLLACGSGFGAEYYVSGGGCDGNNGLSPEKAFRNVQPAADLSRPGDTVWIMDGVYTEPEGRERVLVISKSGEEDNWISYRAYPGHKPVIRFRLRAGVEVQGASYIEIRGLTVIGSSDEISLEYAREQMSNLDNPKTTGNGIFVRGDLSRGRISSHVRILDNHVSDAPGGGIGAMHADYMTIQGNVVDSCGFYAPYANSGISIYQALDVDGNKDYKLIVTGNVSKNNYNYIPFYFSSEDPGKREFTDGNGIIVDDLKGTQDFVNASMSEPYGGRTLIANNICYGNGGSGIHAFKSVNVDIVHNTAYLNGRHPEMDCGQIFANSSEDIIIANNILWALPGKKINDDYKISGVRFLNNLYHDGTNHPSYLVAGEDTVIGDPMFASLPPTGNAFVPGPGSPCIDKGIRLSLHKSGYLKVDAAGAPRQTGAAPDIGAFEAPLPDETPDGQ